MSGTTDIEWTDRVWTPVVGCDPISPACANCYAALMAARLEAMGQEKYASIATRHGNRGKWTGKVTLWEPELLAPLKVRKPATWFLISMGDVGHEAVPDEFLDRLFAVMALCPQHTFYVLTKRPGRLAGYLAGFTWEMTVYYEKARGKWRYHFEIDKKRYPGYCDDPETGAHAERRCRLPAAKRLR